MAIFQRSERDKRDFLKALKAGRVKTEEIRKGLLAHEFKVEDILWCIFEQDANVRKFGLFALTRVAQYDKIPRLFAALSKETSQSRKIALIQAIAYCRDPDTYAQIGKLINSPIADARRMARHIFVKLDGWPRQKGLVTDFVQDPEADIAVAMAKDIVGKCAKQYEGLMRHLAIHDVLEVRQVVIRWLIGQNNPDYAEVFFGRLALEQGTLKEDLLKALSDLAKHDPTRMTKEVVERLGDGSDDVRRAAIELFSRLPNRRESLHLFLSYAAATTGWIRETMFLEAAKFADRFVDPLLDLLEAGIDDELRHHAYAFAYALKHPKLTDLFLRDYQQGDWVQKGQILKMLSEMGTEIAKPVFVAALDQKETRMIAIRGLLRYDDPALTRKLLAMLPSIEAESQIAILEGVSKTTEARSIAFITRFIEEQTNDPEVIEVAARTIGKLCKELQVSVPKRVRDAVRRSEASAVESLPDLGLRLVDD